MKRGTLVKTETRLFIKSIIVKKLQRIAQEIRSTYETGDIVHVSVMGYTGKENPYPQWMREGKYIAKYNITPQQLSAIRLNPNTSVKMPCETIQQIIQETLK